MAAYEIRPPAYVAGFSDGCLFGAPKPEHVTKYSPDPEQYTLYRNGYRDGLAEAQECEAHTEGYSGIMRGRYWPVWAVLMTVVFYLPALLGMTVTPLYSIACTFGAAAITAAVFQKSDR